MTLQRLSAQLPDAMVNRASRYKTKLKAIQFLYGRFLLLEGLKSTKTKDNLSLLYFSDRDKPLLPNTQFNISHSDKLVVCAFSTCGDIGVDVEVPQQIHFENLQHSFTPLEWWAIKEDPDALYTLWCRKEAIIKATGLSLMDLNKIDINNKKNIEISGKTWFTRDLDFLSKYEAKGSICTELPIENIHIEQWF